jgi:predicted RNA-binding protein with PIN domain
MNYIIDGHNLISQLPGIDLNMPDDEQRLIELLILFCQSGKHKLEVYFDRAPVGQAGISTHGRVRAHFVSERSSADDAIRKRLRILGKSARTWVVVSSDRSVQAFAREVHAQVLSSGDFTLLLQSRLPGARQYQPEGDNPTPDVPLSEAEVREWEAIFKGQRKPGSP